MAGLIFCEVHSEYVTPLIGRCPLCRLVISDGFHASAPPQVSAEGEPDGWLVFPWGEEPICGELRIGRFYSYSPIAERLSTYLRISRLHCAVRSECGALWLRQIGKSYPTIVDGEPLEAGAEKVLADGASICFAGQLTALVRYPAALR